MYIHFLGIIVNRIADFLSHAPTLGLHFCLPSHEHYCDFRWKLGIIILSLPRIDFVNKNIFKPVEIR